MGYNWKITYDELTSEFDKNYRTYDLVCEFSIRNRVSKARSTLLLKEFIDSNRGIFGIQRGSMVLLGKNAKFTPINSDGYYVTTIARRDRGIKSNNLDENSINILTQPLELSEKFCDVLKAKIERLETENATLIAKVERLEKLQNWREDWERTPGKVVVIKRYDDDYAVKKMKSLENWRALDEEGATFKIID